MSAIPETVKHVTDAAAGVGVVVTWIANVTPLLNFSVVLLAIVWGVYRIHDMRLAIAIKKEKLNDLRNGQS